MSLHGHNAWFELFTTDVAAAATFYCEVIGWTTRERADRTSMTFMSGERAVGAVLPQTEAAKAKGAPPGWLAHTHVDDVEQTAARAVALGGLVVRGPYDAPGRGRGALLRDPQGAVFSIGAPRREGPAVEPLRSGDFVRSDLLTNDALSALAFHRTLFSWTVEEPLEIPSLGPYWPFEAAHGHTKGGVSNLAAVMGTVPHWIHYISVQNIEAALRKVRDLGGTVVSGPMEVPGGGLCAPCDDPQGGGFALLQAVGSA